MIRSLFIWYRALKPTVARLMKFSRLTISSEEYPLSLMDKNKIRIKEKKKKDKTTKLASSTPSKAIITPPVIEPMIDCTELKVAARLTDLSSCSSVAMNGSNVFMLPVVIELVIDSTDAQILIIVIEPL